MLKVGNAKKKYLHPLNLLPVISIYITWRVIILTAIKPLPSISCILYSLFSPTPYIYFSGSLRILFSLNFRNILYYRGLYSGYSIPMLYIWIRCVPIIYSNNISLGVDYSYRVLYCI